MEFLKELSLIQIRKENQMEFNKDEQEEFGRINELAKKILMFHVSIPKDLALTKIEMIVKNKGYSSKHSKKAIDYMLNNSFNTEVSGGTYFFKVAEVGKKDALFFDLFVFPIKTKNGTVYVTDVTSKNDDKVYKTYNCFTAHFFDRYSQRMHNTTRAQSIKEVFKNIMKNNALSSQYKASCKIYFTNGLGLGNTYIDDNLKIKIDLYKTYISNDMIRPDQLKILKNGIDELKTKTKQLSTLEQDAIENLIDNLINNDNEI